MIKFIYKIFIEIWSFLMKCLSSQLKLNKILVGFALVMGMGVSHTALANNWITTSNNNCKAHNSNPQPNETATWSGECKDGYVHGQGTLQWYENGKPTGIYVGSYSQGKVHGKGVYTWADGGKYDGEWKDSKRHGLGKLTLVKGDNAIASYDNKGEWQGNTYVVQGRFYDGYFDEKMNNEQYANALKKQKAEAKWTLTETYQCKVRNFDSNHTAKWSGGCQDGYVEGYGTLHWYKDDKLTGTYVGSFSEGYMHGKGVYTKANGNKYDGEYKYTNRHGKGIYTWANGSKYDGEWKDGERHGLGKLTLVKGDNGIASYGNKGEWQGDVYVVQGEFYKDNLSWQLNDVDYAFALASPKGADAVRERNQAQNQAQYEAEVANFRKNLQVGDDASAGMVIEIKGDLIKIQTNDSQCSQRDYRGNCENWINTPVEKWVKRRELYPAN